METFIDRYIAQGEQRGEAKMLLRLIERKFGPASEPIRTRITEADSKTLLEWSDRILECTQLGRGNALRWSSSQPSGTFGGLFAGVAFQDLTPPSRVSCFKCNVSRQVRRFLKLQRLNTVLGIVKNSLRDSITPAPNICRATSASFAPSTWPRCCRVWARPPCAHHPCRSALGNGGALLKIRSAFGFS